MTSRSVRRRSVRRIGGQWIGVTDQHVAPPPEMCPPESVLVSLRNVPIAQHLLSVLGSVDVPGGREPRSIREKRPVGRRGGGGPGRKGRMATSAFLNRTAPHQQEISPKPSLAAPTVGSTETASVAWRRGREVRRLGPGGGAGNVKPRKMAHAPP